jgi:hypothetical protein
MSVRFENVPIEAIEFDKTNPRIRWMLEIYPDPQPDQIFLALGSGGDSNGSTYDQLRNSIETNGSIIQPIILNRIDDRLVCVEGNTRVAIYRQFKKDSGDSKWDAIPAMVYEGLAVQEMDAIRLQAHLVGPRDWDPYSKAKYLHHLRKTALQPFDRIVDFCGGDRRMVNELIQAYTDMEEFYRPLADEGSFDVTRFSGFRELQKSKIKEALFEHKYGVADFAKWIHERKIDPLNTVRQIPAVLANPRAKDIFLRTGMRNAIKVLDRPDLGTDLRNASLAQLARGLTEAIDKLEWGEQRRLLANPEDETVSQLHDALEALTGLTDYLRSGT